MLRREMPFKKECLPIEKYYSQLKREILLNDSKIFLPRNIDIQSYQLLLIKIDVIWQKSAVDLSSTYKVIQLLLEYE